MTLNVVTAVILRYYTECINFKHNYVKLVEATLCNKNAVKGIKLFCVKERRSLSNAII